jgi:hypothetical protein
VSQRKLTTNCATLACSQHYTASRLRNLVVVTSPVLAPDMCNVMWRPTMVPALGIASCVTAQELRGMGRAASGGRARPGGCMPAWWQPVQANGKQVARCNRRPHQTCGGLHASMQLLLAGAFLEVQFARGTHRHSTPSRLHACCHPSSAAIVVQPPTRLAMFPPAAATTSQTAPIWSLSMSPAELMRIIQPPPHLAVSIPLRAASDAFATRLELPCPL